MEHSKVGSALLAAIALVCGSPRSLLADGVAAPVSYDLKVRIDPEPGDLAVKGRVEFENPGLQRFEFDLHETFSVKALLVNGTPAKFSFAPAEFSPLTPAARVVVVEVPPGTPPGTLRMDVEYAGRLKKLPEFGAGPEGTPSMDDQVNSHLVELAGFSSWYPQFFFGGAPVRAEFELSLPQGWVSVGSGREVQERVDAGRSITRWSSPKDLDLLVVASPDFRRRVFRQSGVDIEIYHTRMPEKFVEAEVQQIASVVQLYTDRLGETDIPGGKVRHVYSPRLKGQGKAGTARPGLIVTSEGITLESLAADPRFSLFQPIAHEIAHFWWNFGAGQGDWINEASAEYFSAVAVQKTASDAEFGSILDDYRNQVRALPADAPSLATVPFINDDVRYVVRYFKGALLLHFLRESLGDDAFFAACREFFQTYRGKTVGTPEFRTFWKTKLADRGSSVDRWLDSPGGLPGQEVESQASGQGE
jgi:aminopeptidase N